MSNCVCGRTTRKPMCDKSCSLSIEQYKERTKRLEELFKKPSKETNEQSLGNPNKYSTTIGE